MRYQSLDNIENPFVIFKLVSIDAIAEHTICLLLIGELHINIIIFYLLHIVLCI